MSCENSRKLISTKNLKGAEIQAARTIEFNPVPGSPINQSTILIINNHLKVCNSNIRRVSLWPVSDQLVVSTDPFILSDYLPPNSCRSRRTQTSPVGTSCSSRRRVTAPLFSNSFFMVATGTSVRPRKTARSERRRGEHVRRSGGVLVVELSPDCFTLQQQHLNPPSSVQLFTEKINRWRWERRDWPSGENWSRSKMVIQRTSW